MVRHQAPHLCQMGDEPYPGFSPCDVDCMSIDLLYVSTSLMGCSLAAMAMTMDCITQEDSSQGLQ